MECFTSGTSDQGKKVAVFRSLSLQSGTMYANEICNICLKVNLGCYSLQICKDLLEYSGRNCNLMFEKCKSMLRQENLADLLLIALGQLKT